MKIDFNTELTDLDGKPIRESGADDAGNATLGFIAIQACLGSMKGDEEMSGEEKLKLYQIASKIADGRKKKTAVDMPIEDVTEIKSRVGRMFTPAIVGPVYGLLD